MSYYVYLYKKRALAAETETENEQEAAAAPAEADEAAAALAEAANEKLRVCTDIIDQIDCQSQRKLLLTLQLTLIVSKIIS